MNCFDMHALMGKVIEWKAPEDSASHGMRIEKKVRERVP